VPSILTSDWTFSVIQSPLRTIFGYATGLGVSRTARDRLYGADIATAGKPPAQSVLRPKAGPFFFCLFILAFSKSRLWRRNIFSFPVCRPAPKVGSNLTSPLPEKYLTKEIERTKERTKEM